MDVVLPVSLLVSLGGLFLWMAFKASREPTHRRVDHRRAIIGNTMASKTTESGKTIILCATRPE